MIEIMDLFLYVINSVYKITVMCLNTTEEEDKCYCLSSTNTAQSVIMIILGLEDIEAI